MTDENEEYIDIKSKPIYVPLEFDPKTRFGILVAETEGLRGLIDLLSNSSEMQAANTQVLYSGSDSQQSEAESFFNHSKCCELTLFSDQESQLESLIKLLNSSVMGTRLYMCGSEAYIWKVAKIARDAGMNKSEYHMKLIGSKARRVYCPHCETMNVGVTTDIHECQGCNLSLVNCNHFSREMCAYLGYRVDAEVPGEMPDRQELYT